MDMVGHEDVTPNCDVILLGSRAKAYERFVDLPMREQRLSEMGVESDEIEWADMPEEPCEPGRAARVVSAWLHAETR
jgi:hypothetical protein